MQSTLELAVAFLTLEDGHEDEREAAWWAQMTCPEPSCFMGGPRHHRERPLKSVLNLRRQGEVTASARHCFAHAKPPRQRASNSLLSRI